MSSILLVDDDSYLLQGLKRVLRMKEPAWTVTTAQSLTEALRQAEQRDIDAVVSDIHMPGGDGLELVRALRSLARFRTVPIILLTGSVEDTVYDQGRALGATDVLTKPCSLDMLLARLRSLIAPSPAGENSREEDPRSYLAPAA